MQVLKSGVLAPLVPAWSAPLTTTSSFRLEMMGRLLRNDNDAETRLYQGSPTRRVPSDVGESPSRMLPRRPRGLMQATSASG